MSEGGYQHRDSYRDLVTSGEENCPLCGCFVTNLCQEDNQTCKTAANVILQFQSLNSAVSISSSGTECFEGTVGLFVKPSSYIFIKKRK
jgi:hypothetical protein